MKRIKIGQIGICHEHADGKMSALRKLPELYELVGVVDDRQSTAAKRAGDDLNPYQGLRWLSEDELFNIPDLQAVTVETPNMDLVPTAMRCMDHNLAIHMDKPGGEELEIFKNLIDGCEERGLPFQMGYMFRNNPAMQWCLKAVRKGWLGEIFEIHAGMSHDYGGEDYQKYLENFKGGIMFNLGCHLIDFVVAMMGRPDNVTPFLKSAPGYDRNFRNNCLCVMEYQNAMAVVNVSSKEVNGLENRRMKVYGTKGTFDLCPLECFDGSPLQMRITLKENNSDYPAGTHLVDAGIRDDRYTDQLMELAKIINGEMDNPYTYEHDFLVQEATLAASGYINWRK